MKREDCTSLSDVEEYIQLAHKQEADGTDAPCWPEDAILTHGVEKHYTVWSWDFRDDDGNVPSGECCGELLAGWDGTSSEPPCYRVDCMLTAKDERGNRHVILPEDG